MFFNAFSQTWTPLEMHAGGKVTGIIGHPTDANTVYARTDVAGIYKSTNKGNNWEQLLLSVPKYSDHVFKVRSFIINPNNANEMFFASGNSAGGDHSGIWKSSDAGNTWSLKTELAAFSGNGSYRWVDEVMAYRPSATTTLYAGAQPKVVGGTAEKGGVFVSNDSGETWSKVNNSTFDDKWITKLIFDPDNDDILYIAAVNPNITGISTSGGLWSFEISTETVTQLTANEVVDMDFDAVDKDTMLAVGPSGIFTSNDKGANWSTPTKPFGHEYTSFVTPHPTETNHWFFGSTQGFFSNGFLETDDGLATFYFTTYGLPGSVNHSRITWPPYAAANTNTQPIFGGALSNLFFHPLETTTAYFNNVWRCDNATGLLVDKANTNQRTNANWDWTFTAKGIYIMVGIRVSLHPTDENRYTLNVADVNQYETFNNGGELLYYGLMQKLNYSAVTKYFEGNDDIRYSAGNDNFIQGTLNKTIDGGTTWVELESDFFDGSKVIQDLEIDPNDSNIVILGLENTTLPSQVYRTDDGGTTWNPWDTGIEGELIFKKWEAWPRLIQDNDGQTYYTWNSNKLFKRGITDASWTEISLPVTNTPMRRVATARNISGSLYVVFNQNNQLHVSKDYGVTWTAYNLPYSGDSEFVSVSPSGKRAIVARRENFPAKREFGVWINNDIENGSAWDAISLATHPTTTKTMTFLTEERIASISRGHGSYYTEIDDPTLSAEEDKVQNKFMLVPNPSDGVTRILSPFGFNETELEFSIIDMSGRVIKKDIGTIVNAALELDVSSLSKGLYFIQLSLGNDKQQTLKIIKN